MVRRGMTRYTALAARAAAGQARVVLPFATIEGEILRWPLPPSPRIPGRRWNWWYQGGRSPHAWEGWLRAGWRVEGVDRAGEVVTFVRGAGE